MEEEQQQVLVALENRITKATHALSWYGLRRRAYRFVAAYGFAPSRAFLGLLVCALIYGLLAHLSRGAFALSGQIPGADKAVFSPVRYTLESILPLPGGGQGIRWQVNQHHRWSDLLYSALTLIRLAAWALAGIALASITGLVRRK